jgi:hypothetical protein
MPVCREGTSRTQKNREFIFVFHAFFCGRLIRFAINEPAVGNAQSQIPGQGIF